MTNHSLLISPSIYYLGNGEVLAALIHPNSSLNISANGATESEAIKNLQVEIDKKNKEIIYENRLRYNKLMLKKEDDVHYET